MHAKPSFYASRGTLSLAADEIRPVGLGELLARLERRRQLLAAEGLFAAERKRPLPFLPAPRRPGLRPRLRRRARRRSRTPGAAGRRSRSEIENVAVQGRSAVAEVIEALARLDRDPEVDVIVIARGGGSVEDLLPFSDEALVRAVAALPHARSSARSATSRTPRCSTSSPTSAPRPRPTPPSGSSPTSPRSSTASPPPGVGCARRMASRIDRETAMVLALRSRPCLADPSVPRRGAHADVVALRDRSPAARSPSHSTAPRTTSRHTRARVTALSPAATLERGYAVLQRSDGGVVRRAGDTAVGEPLRARLAEGELGVEVRSATPPPESGDHEGSDRL